MVSEIVNTWVFELPARTQTAIQFPAALGLTNASDPVVVEPKSLLVCCTRAMFPVVEVTAKFTPLLGTPPTLTTTLPGVAPAGTGAVMLVSAHVDTVADAPLNVTVPAVVPKFDPEIVTEVPTGPEVGLRLLMLGGGVTVKGTPLLPTPPTKTTTFPEVAPVGTGMEILVSDQLVDRPWVPLKVTKLDIVPTVGPKFVPVMVTRAPTGPELRLRLVIFGGGVTVKFTPLLARLLTVTMTFPVVAPEGTVTSMLDALQFVGVAAIPLKVTELEFCIAPKFDPVIVTFAPTGPWVRLNVEMLGAAGGLFVREKLAGVATPATDAVTL